MSERFFVHVVESPSPADMLDGNFEGRVLYQALCTSRIDASYSIAADSQTFFEAIGNRLLDRIIADQYRRWPVVHISAHGDPNGIGLTSGEYVTWSRLGTYFRVLNDLMKGTLLVSMSSCHGSWASLEALAHEKSPFYAIVGPREKMSLSDLAIGFSSYYHVLSKTWKLADAHAAMRAAAHNDAFMLFETEILKDGFAKWSLEQRINHALTEMADNGVPEAPEAPPAEQESHAP